jgi:hypothetical protein
MTTATHPLGQRFVDAPSAMEEEPSAVQTRGAVSDDTESEPTATAEALEAKGDRDVGRFHNRDNPSPSEMAEMLREVQDALALLEERLAGLEGAQSDSFLVTRRLALSVAEMGETLARRVRSLETGDAAPRPPAPTSDPTPISTPPPAPIRAPSPFAASLPWRPVPARGQKGGRVDTVVLVLGVVVLIALIVIGLWVFGRQRAAGGSAAKSPAAVATAVPAPAPPAVASPAAAPFSAVHRFSPPRSTTPRHYSFYPTHRPYTRRATPAAPAADVPPATGFGSFGPAATNSVPKSSP